MGFGGAASADDWLASPYLDQIGRNVARRHGLAPEDLPDLLQEIRIALWEAGLDARLGSPWVLRVASNKAVDLVRLRARVRAVQSIAVEAVASGTSQEELGHLLNAKVDSLPRRLRRFYDLHYRLGLSEREIARRIGVSRASVRWLDHCCRRIITGRAQF
jgi:RNA polymerase sigma factor (sigma-70 family)